MRRIIGGTPAAASPRTSEKRRSSLKDLRLAVSARFSTGSPKPSARPFAASVPSSTAAREAAAISVQFAPESGGSEARHARWGRDPSQLRSAKISALERELASVADDDDDDDDDDPEAWRERGWSVEQQHNEPMELSGFLLKRSGTFSAQNRRFFLLKQGTLAWYKGENTDGAPQGYCHLAEATLISEYPVPPSGSTSTRSVSSKSASEMTQPPPADGVIFLIRARKDYMLWADEPQERSKWLRALRHNRHMPPIPGLAPPQQVRDGSTASSASSSGGGGRMSRFTDWASSRASSAKDVIFIGDVDEEVSNNSRSSSSKHTS